MSINSVSIMGDVGYIEQGVISLSIEHENELTSFLIISLEEESIRIDTKDLIETLRVLGCLK